LLLAVCQVVLEVQGLEVVGHAVRCLLVETSIMATDDKALGVAAEVVVEVVGQGDLGDEVGEVAAAGHHHRKKTWMQNWMLTMPRWKQNSVLVA
jgi:hypothetical protein